MVLQTSRSLRSKRPWLIGCFVFFQDIDVMNMGGCKKVTSERGVHVRDP